MKSKDTILETNIKQKEFYNTKKKNSATKIWSGFRNGVLNKIKKILVFKIRLIFYTNNGLETLKIKKF